VKLCKSGFQLMTILGFVLLANSAFATYQCSSLFETVKITEKKLQDIIINVAQMKLQSDLIQIQGPSQSSLIERQTQELFELKWDELVRVMKGRYSEGLLKQLVMTEVRKLQKILEHEKLKEEKAKQDTGVSSNRYKLTSRELVHGKGTMLQKHLPDSASLLMTRSVPGLALPNNEIIRYDLGLKEDLVIATGTSPNLLIVLKDNKSIITLDSNHENILTYDIDSGSHKTTVPLRWPSKRADKFYLSPDNLTLAAGDFARLTLFEVATGKVVREAPMEKIMAAMNEEWVISSHLFIDNDHFLFTGTSGKSLIWEISTDKFVVQDAPGKTKVLTNDGLTIIESHTKKHDTTQKITLYSADKLETGKSSSITITADDPYEIFEVPGRRKLIFMLNVRGKKAYLAKREQIDVPVLDLDKHYKPLGYTVQNASPSTDGRIIFLLLTRWDPVVGHLEYFIDEWRSN